MVTILDRAGLTDLRRMVAAQIAQPCARWPAGYPFHAILPVERHTLKQGPNIYRLCN